MLKMKVQSLRATSCTTVLIISDTVHTKLKSPYSSNSLQGNVTFT